MMVMPPMITSNLPASNAGMMPSQAVGTNSDLDAHVFGKLRGDIDLEADQFTLLIAHRPGHEGRHTDAQHAVLLDRLDHALG